MRNENVLLKMKKASMTYGEQLRINRYLPNKVHISKHAFEQAEKRGFKLMPNQIIKHMDSEFLEEVQVDKNEKVKFLIRYPYNKAYDIVLVVAKNGCLVTCWLNHKHDTHKTLKDKHLYVPNFGQVESYLK